MVGARKSGKVRQEVEALRPQDEIARAIIAARQARGLSQAALAKQVGTKQSAIARLESGSYNPSLGASGQGSRGP
ncbi:MAG: helix-turn-helix transcriptional regulator, partial [Clostridia bacterium]|nr:helix-turn-helix transcriptional regulator [Clostridia bacterium]